MTTAILLNASFGGLIVVALLVLLAHAIHTDRPHNEAHVRAFPQSDHKRIAA